MQYTSAVDDASRQYDVRQTAIMKRVMCVSTLARSDGNSGDSGVPPAVKTRLAPRGVHAVLAQTFIIAQQRSS